MGIDLEIVCSRRGLFRIAERTAALAGTTLILGQIYPFSSLVHGKEEDPSPALYIKFPMIHDLHNGKLRAPQAIDEIKECQDKDYIMGTPSMVNSLVHGLLPIPKSPVLSITLDDGFSSDEEPSDSQADLLTFAYEEFTLKQKIPWGAVWSPIMGFDRKYDLEKVPFDQIPDNTPCFRIGPPPTNQRIPYFKWEYATKGDILRVLSLKSNDPSVPDPKIVLGIHGVTHTPLVGMSEAQIREEIGGSVNLIKEFYKAVGKECKLIPMTYVAGVGAGNPLVKRVLGEVPECALGFTVLTNAQRYGYAKMIDLPDTTDFSNPMAIARPGRT